MQTDCPLKDFGNTIKSVKNQFHFCARISFLLIKVLCPIVSWFSVAVQNPHFLIQERLGFADKPLVTWNKWARVSGLQFVNNFNSIQAPTSLPPKTMLLKKRQVEGEKTRSWLFVLKDCKFSCGTKLWLTNLWLALRWLVKQRLNSLYHVSLCNKFGILC